MQTIERRPGSSGRDESAAVSKPDAKDGLPILVADDDAVSRRLLVNHLQSAGYRPLVAADGAAAIELMTAEILVALVDLQMPKAGGLDCLKHAQKHFPDMQVLVISQFGEIRDAVEAMKQGAFDYIAKPVERDELLARLKQAFRSAGLARENRQLKQAVGGSMPRSSLVGDSSATLKLLEVAAKIASLDSTVLITGESGTGKTSLARHIHQSGPRAPQPFVAVNCGSLPRDLIESELFGHVRGAFTGAVADRPGRAEMADGGTLFLDEIGDLPLELQPKLLSFLQDRMVQRIGDTRERAVDVRVIAATHQDLEEKCRQGGFREDLFFRLNVLPIQAAPLRERPEDIPLIASFLLQRIAAKRKCPPFTLSDDAQKLLLIHDWPGNVRELENAMERASAFCTNSTITAADLALPARITKDIGSLTENNAHESLAGMTMAEVEKRAILDTLKKCDGNKKEAARMLGIDEKSIYNKLKRLGLSDLIHR